MSLLPINCAETYSIVLASWRRDKEDGIHLVSPWAIFEGKKKPAGEPAGCSTKATNTG
jgi:hypothetical protein